MSAKIETYPGSVAGRLHMPSIDVGHVAQNPWTRIEIPEPPAGAPREQLFEFGALCGGCSLRSIDRFVQDIVRAYCEKWHPEMGLPE